MATILVVDDDPAILRLVGVILEREGHDVLLAGDGPQAIAAIQRHQGAIQLLITDLMMGPTDGNRLSEALRSRLPGVHTLYMSGFPRASLREWGIEPSASFVEKPFSPMTLSRSVLAMLEAGTIHHSQ